MTPFIPHIEAGLRKRITTPPRKRAAWITRGNGTMGLNNEIDMLKGRLEKIDNQRHAALQENNRLTLILNEYREQAAGQSGPFVTNLRDWFAGQALIGQLSNSEQVHAGVEPTMSILSGDRRESFAAFLAKEAYAIADAMLAARKGGA